VVNEVSGTVPDLPPVEQGDWVVIPELERELWTAAESLRHGASLFTGPLQELERAAKSLQV